MANDGVQDRDSSNVATQNASNACSGALTVGPRETPSDDERATAFETEMKIPKAKSYEVRTWRAGRWSCLQDDFDRLNSRDRWLSGDGIAVFAAVQLKAARVDTVDVIHPLLLQEVEWRADALSAGNTTQAKVNANNIIAVLLEVRAVTRYERRGWKLMFKQAVHPNKATKWLIPAHVPAPLHWTLAEVRWETLTIHFYDSFSVNGGYAHVVEQRVRGLLELAQEAFSLTTGAADWTWIKEQVRRRRLHET